MTRKHFEAIASTIRNSAVDNFSREIIAKELAATLSTMNDRFDTDRFITDCITS